MPAGMNGPSIKSVMSGNEVSDNNVTVKEQFDLYHKQDEYEPFTEDQLLAKWAEYLITLEDRPNLKATLSRTPNLNINRTLTLSVDNHLQDEMVKSIKPNLVSWLRRELHNASIDLITEVVVNNVQKVAYTDSEKFEEMVRKNKQLATLKRTFNLDFDN